VIYGKNLRSKGWISLPRVSKREIHCLVNITCLLNKKCQVEKGWPAFEVSVSG
jgi:hypothetical protein